jgi:hypothetical protein
MIMLCCVFLVVEDNCEAVFPDEQRQASRRSQQIGTNRRMRREIHGPHAIISHISVTRVGNIVDAIHLSDGRFVTLRRIEKSVHPRLTLDRIFRQSSFSSEGSLHPFLRDHFAR